MAKTLRPVKTWRMIKSLRPVKTRRMVKTLRPVKTWRILKTRRMAKTQRPLNLRRLVKYQCPWKCWRSRKSRRICWRTPYCLGSAESAAADISLVQLMNTFSFLLMLNCVHVVSKRGMSPPCPAFMGGLSPVPCRLLVAARHAQKWSKTRRRPKTRRLPEIPLISVQTIAVSISAYRCPIEEPEKHN
jgi:hypothetical protein